MINQTTVINKDSLRMKMDQHVIDHIHLYITPAYRQNGKAISLARTWCEDGLSLYEINNQLGVIEPEYQEIGQLQSLEEVSEQEQVNLEENRDKDDLGTEFNDTYYLHF